MDQEFTVRACRREELVEWGTLCGKAFSHRSGRPQRFLEKYLNDPTKDLEGLRVAVTNDGRIVSTVRVFNRSVRLGNEIVPLAGIGEVCTDPAYRGKGLARLVMDDACAYIDRSTALLSSLSAAEGVEKFYASYGYKHTPVHYGILRVPLDLDCTANDSASMLSPVREDPAIARATRRIEQLSRSFAASAMSSESPTSKTASTPKSSVSSTVSISSAHSHSADVTFNLPDIGKVSVRKVDISAKAFELSMLYDAYSEGLHGVLMRSHAYWRDFVAEKLSKDGIWAAFTCKDGSEAMIAYVAIAEKRGELKLAEYGALKNLRNNGALFDQLVKIAVANNSVVQTEEKQMDSLLVEAPMAVLQRLESSTIKIDSEKSDNAWMYRIRPSIADGQDPVLAQHNKKLLSPADYLQTLKTAADKNTHVIWFTDAF